MLPYVPLCAWFSPPGREEWMLHLEHKYVIIICYLYESLFERTYGCHEGDPESPAYSCDSACQRRPGRPLERSGVLRALHGTREGRDGDLSDTPPESLQFLPGFAKLTQEIQESQNFVITVNLEDGVEVDKLRYTVEDGKVNIIVVPRHGRIEQRHIHFGEGDGKYDLIVVVDTADLALLGTLYKEHAEFSRRRLSSTSIITSQTSASVRCN